MFGSRLGSSIFIFYQIRLTKCSLLGSSAGSDDRIQISFLALPKDKDLRFALLRAWLERCDEHHHCSKEHGHEREMPTRLLDMADPDNLRLVPGQDRAGQCYVALSHCWGKTVPDEIPPYCTTTGNIGAREKGFRTIDLPRTFQDAVQVARGLGVQYLWIDSLCIIQGDGGDWEQELRHMEDVYASAYCTIAATSAVDSNSGFLERNVESEHICVGDDLGRRVYVCTDVADFDLEVERAELNKRAWVVQERFLSCRTIHFGTKQTYWECGEGVYCEDLTRLER